MKINFLKRGVSLVAAAVMTFSAQAALASAWPESAPGNAVVSRQSDTHEKLKEALEKLGKTPAPSTVSINMINTATNAPTDAITTAATTTASVAETAGASVHTFSSGFTWAIPAPGAYSAPSGFSVSKADLQAGYDMPYVIAVDVTNQVTSVVALDSDGQYSRLIRQFVCSTGTVTDPTPIGTHYLMGGERNDWAYFKTFNCYVRYPVRIYGNYFFHSLLYSRQDEASLKTSSFRNLGSRASHGCIRMLDDDVKWVSENCHEGTAVVVFEGTYNAELTASMKP